MIEFYTFSPLFHGPPLSLVRACGEMARVFRSATGTAVGTAVSEQGTKRKRGGQSEDDDDESGAHGEGSNDAAPLCWL